MPSLSADLRPSSAQLLWITDIYGFLLAGSLITMGTLGDRIGRRRLLLLGAGAFGAASVLAAYASSAGMLIAARALLGVAGATLAPSTLSLLRTMFLDSGQRTVAISVGLTVPEAGGLIVGSLLTPVLVRRVRPAFVMAAGMVLAAVGLGLLTQLDGVSGLAVVVTGSAVFSLGLAPVVTLATDLIVGSAPPERAGAAAGISETSAEFGGALGIAILRVIGTAIYRGEVANALPAGVPGEAAAAARDTLGGALAVADQLPDQLGAALLVAGRQAFTQGFQVTAALTAGLAIGIAVLAAALLRHVRPSSQADQQPNPTETKRA